LEYYINLINMREYYSIGLFISVLIILITSCKTEDINPDKLSSEIIVTFDGSNTDTTYHKAITIWSIINYTGLTPTRNKSFGHCWKFNTDTLPTIKSDKNIQSYYENCRLSDHADELMCIAGPFRSEIPISKSVKKLIVRGFLIYNDTLIRYSAPLVLNNPGGYAN